MMQYFAKLKKQRRGYLVEFPVLPGCLSEGSNASDALKNAKEALDGWLAAHCDRNLEIPIPRTYRGRRYYPIVVDFRIEFAVRLRMLRKKLQLSQGEVARRLDVSQQAYSKLETPYKTNPSLTTLEKLSRALNAELDIKLVA